MRNARPQVSKHPTAHLALVPPPDWTERPAYKAALKELERMSTIEGRREAQLISEAEHAAELRYLRRKAVLLGKMDTV